MHQKFSHFSLIMPKIYRSLELSNVFSGHLNIIYAGLVGNVARFIYISYLENPWWVLPFEFVQGKTNSSNFAITSDGEHPTPVVYPGLPEGGGFEKS